MKNPWHHPKRGRTLATVRSSVRNGICGRWRDKADELYTPAKDGGFLVLILGQGCALEDLQRVHDGHASVKLSAWHVIVEILGIVSVGLEAEGWCSHRYTTGWPPWACLGQIYGQSVPI